MWVKKGRRLVKGNSSLGFVNFPFRKQAVILYLITLFLGCSESESIILATYIRGINWSHGETIPLRRVRCIKDEAAGLLQLIGVIICWEGGLELASKRWVLRGLRGKGVYKVNLIAVVVHSRGVKLGSVSRILEREDWLVLRYILGNGLGNVLVNVLRNSELGRLQSYWLGLPSVHHHFVSTLGWRIKSGLIGIALLGLRILNRFELEGNCWSSGLCKLRLLQCYWLGTLSGFVELEDIWWGLSAKRVGRGICRGSTCEGIGL